MGHSHGDQLLSEQPRKLLRFKLGAVLLIALAACGAQFLGAILTGSIALMAESVHMLVDLIGLSVAFAATLIPESRTAETRKRVEAISALIQSTLLVGVGIYAALRGLKALAMPHSIAGEYLLIFAAAGLMANLAAVAILYSSRQANLNFRAAFLEVISDALGSLVVIGAGVAVLAFRFYPADAIAALLLAALMIPRGIGILRSALAQLFPARRKIGIPLALIVSLLFGLGVSKLHQLYAPTDLHLPIPAAEDYSWSSSGSPKLTLSFSPEDGIATLTEGCSSAISPFQGTYGGVLFMEFQPLVSDCDGPFPEELLTAKTAYYGKNFESLKIYTETGGEIAVVSSEQRLADQQIADSWKPWLELLFRL